MSDEQTTKPDLPVAPADGTPPNTFENLAPDDLMNDFKGRSLMKILFVVLLLHVIVIGGFSFGYIKESIVGKGEGLAEDARMELAVREISESLRDISQEYKVDSDALVARLSGGRGAASAPAGETPADAAGTDSKPDEAGAGPGEAADPVTPDEGLSDIEKAIREEVPGPAVPELDSDITEEDPIFPE